MTLPEFFLYCKNDITRGWSRKSRAHKSNNPRLLFNSLNFATIIWHAGNTIWTSDSKRATQSYISQVLYFLASTIFCGCSELLNHVYACKLWKEEGQGDENKILIAGLLSTTWPITSQSVDSCKISKVLIKRWPKLKTYGFHMNTPL